MALQPRHRWAQREHRAQGPVPSGMSVREVSDTADCPFPWNPGLFLDVEMSTHACTRQGDSHLLQAPAGGLPGTHRKRDWPGPGGWSGPWGPRKTLTVHSSPWCLQHVQPQMAAPCSRWVSGERQEEERKQRTESPLCGGGWVREKQLGVTLHLSRVLRRPGFNLEAIWIFCPSSH